jgi:5'-nucleotidase
LHILLTNDDGYLAPGIKALHDILKGAGHTVAVVAPERERSGVSLSITLTDILRAWPMTYNGMQGWIVNGTPADCVKLAVGELMDEPPDVIFSGINQGTNVGLNANYSGTVAGAAEGALMGRPAVAVSLASFKSRDFEAAARVGLWVLEHLEEGLIPPLHLLSVNVPEGRPEELRGIRVTPASKVMYREVVDRRVDHRGREYYWLAGRSVQLSVTPGGDHETVEDGYISITPLRVDWTSNELLEELRRRGWDEEWNA